MPLIDSIAAYGARDTTRALPDEVLHHAKRAVIDWFSALLPGTRVAPATLLVAAHREELDSGRSSLPGFGTTAFPALAAWINGSASHTVEFDDIFKDAAYHPGCPTIAAALALAEDRRASGAQLLNAIVVGYEIATRIGVAVQPSHYRFFHTTGTVGSFGAAAAGAALLAPGDATVLKNALANAGSFAAGLQQAFRSDSMTKPLHAGHAANVGVLAAKAAAQGVTGAPDILEGAAGFGAAMSAGGRWEAATDGLGSRYNITQMTQKNHGCCGHTFAAIDAVLALRAAGLEAAQVQRIDVATYQTALDVAGIADPRTASEAKFSLAYVLAHALLHGSVRLDAFSDERLHDPALRALLGKVQLHADPQMSAAFPAQRAARVTVTLLDGRSVEHFAPCRKGDPEAPLSDAEIDDKFDELATPVIGVARAHALRAQLWRLQDLQLADLRLASY